MRTPATTARSSSPGPAASGCGRSTPAPSRRWLGRTLRAWRAQVLAYFDPDGLSNGGTEAINMLIEKTRRLAHGYRNFNTTGSGCC